MKSADRGGPGAWSEVWEQIEAIVAKTALAAVSAARKTTLSNSKSSIHAEFKNPIQEENMLSCEYAVLTMDFLIDTNLQPWLLEVNRGSSFNPSSDLDTRKFAIDLFGFLASRGELSDVERTRTNELGNSVTKNYNFHRVWPQRERKPQLSVERNEKSWWERVYDRRTQAHVEEISNDLQRLQALSKAVEDGIVVVTPADVIDLTNILHFSTAENRKGHQDKK